MQKPRRFRFPSIKLLNFLCLLIFVSGCGLEDDPYELRYSHSKDTPDVIFNNRSSLLVDSSKKTYLAITRPTDSEFFFQANSVKGMFKKSETQGSSVPNPFHDCGHRQLYDLTLHYLEAGTSAVYKGVGWKYGCE